MIIAAGLTPAWQTIMRFERLTPGEVNRAQEVHHFASGKALNVAVALAHLGAPCKAISVIGGASRELIDCDLSTFTIARHWVISTAATRSCVTLLDAASGQTTELVQNAHPITESELEEFTVVFVHDSEQAEVVVLTGSLPRGVSNDYYKQLISGVKCPVILDARGPELLAALEHRPWLVKPNREELSATVGSPLATDAELDAAMRELVDRGAQRVFVSNGAAPAWYRDGGKLFRVTPQPIKRVVNPIGSGDCLAAGVAFALTQGQPPIECIAFGMAAAAENVGQLLTGRSDAVSVRRRVSKIKVEQVSG